MKMIAPKPQFRRMVAREWRNYRTQSRGVTRVWGTNPVSHRRNPTARPRGRTCALAPLGHLPRSGSRFRRKRRKLPCVVTFVVTSHNTRLRRQGRSGALESSARGADSLISQNQNWSGNLASRSLRHSHAPTHGGGACWELPKPRATPEHRQGRNTHRPKGQPRQDSAGNARCPTRQGGSAYYKNTGDFRGIWVSRVH